MVNAEQVQTGEVQTQQDLPSVTQQQQQHEVSQPNVSTPNSVSEAASSGEAKEEMHASTDASISQREQPKFTRSQLANIVKEAQEKARKQAIEEFQRSNQNPAVTNAQQQQSDPAGINVREQLQNIILEEQLKIHSSQLLNKVNEGEKKYSDFNDVTKDLTSVVNSRTAPLFNSIDNAEDVIYDLGKNPEHLSQLLPLISYPDLAVKMLGKLSQSIKANQAAKTQPVAPKPLATNTPSLTGVDSGLKNPGDYRKLRSHRF